MLRPAKQKNREETKQLKKEENELNCTDQSKRDPEGIMTMSEWEKIYKKERESVEIRQWKEEKTGWKYLLVSEGQQ